ncbi:MAG: helix-turn-helix domain-containing protein [Desulfobulbia bacterium]
MTTKESPFSGEGSGAAQQRPRHPNTAEAQRQRILDHLSMQSLNTIESREQLDVLHPAARIMELRKRGYNIETHWVTEPTGCGRLHRVAKYILLTGGR